MATDRRPAESSQPSWTRSWAIPHRLPLSSTASCGHPACCSLTAVLSSTSARRTPIRAESWSRSSTSRAPP
eukprot:16216179-Heterocapsa_arctica.AAC.1